MFLHKTNKAPLGGLFDLGKIIRNYAVVITSRAALSSTNGI